MSSYRKTGGKKKREDIRIRGATSYYSKQEYSHWSINKKRIGSVTIMEQSFHFVHKYEDSEFLFRLIHS